MDCIHVEGDPEPVEDIQHNENKAKTNTPDPTIWAGTDILSLPGCCHMPGQDIVETVVKVRGQGWLTDASEPENPGNHAHHKHWEPGQRVAASGPVQHVVQGWEGKRREVDIEREALDMEQDHKQGRQFRSGESLELRKQEGKDSIERN